MAFRSASLPTLLGFLIPLAVLAVGLGLLPSSRYLLKQAGPFLRHHLGAKPVKRVLENEETGAQTREFLRRVRDIRRFAVHELGLAETANYSTYYELDRDYLAAVVQAAPEFSTEPHMFSYPLFGEMPYKGFYDVQAAKAEAEQLEKEGLDVYVRRVDAFSSLGFFTDPLFSFMKEYPPDRLAELIIHEQTHATIFIKGFSKFNEQLATFMGRKGAALYIAENYGRDSSEYEAMMRRRHDAWLFREDMASLASKLRELYASGAEEELMRQRKRELFRGFRQRFSERYSRRYETGGYAGIADLKLNNAFISLFGIYEPQNSLFEELYAQAGDLASMIAYLKDAPGLEEDPWEVKIPGE